MAGDRGISAGKAYVTLGIKDETKKALRRASNNLKKWSRQTAIAAGAIGAPLVLAARQFAKTGDQIGKMAKRTNLSTDAIQSFGFAMEQSGSSMEALEPAIKGMNRNLVDMSRDLSSAKDNFEGLGLNFDDFMKLGTADRFRAILNGLKGIDDEGMRSGLAVKFLGRSGEAVLPLLGNLKGLEAEFKTLGDSMSGEQIAQAEEMTDAFNKVERQFKAVAIQVGAALGPALTDIADAITPMIQKVVKWVKANKGFVVGAGEVAVAIGGVSLAMKALSVVLATNPFVLIATAAIAAIPAVNRLNKAIGNTKQNLAGVGGRFGPDAKNVIGHGGGASNATKQALQSKDEIRKLNKLRLRDPRERERIAKGFEKLGGKVGGFFQQMKTNRNNAARKEQFNSIAKSVGEGLKGSFQSVGDSIKNGLGLAATGIELANAFGNQQSIAASMSSFTTGGLGGAALGITATQGAASPMDELRETAERQEDLLDSIDSHLDFIRGKGQI